MKQENLNKIDLTASITAIFNHENAYEARIAKALLRGGIQTVCDLCCQTKEGLLNIRGIGNNSISAIEEKLNDAGLHLDMSEDELSAYSNQVENQQTLHRMLRLTRNLRKIASKRASPFRRCLTGCAKTWKRRKTSNVVSNWR